MISREKDTDHPSTVYYDLILDDIVLSDFDGSAEQLQHLLNIDCALALSVCKSRNFPSCVFVLSLLYIKRLRALRSSSSVLVQIDNLTTKELYLIATLLANKYLIDEGEDEQLFNSELAEVTGLTTDRVKYLERQVLIALNWNLHISTDEFQRFFSLFKNQMARQLNKNVHEIEDAESLKLFSHMIQYLALTSLVLLGSTLSILTAIHISAFTHSTLMKTLQPTIDNYSNIDNNYENGNFSFIKHKIFSHFERYTSNETTAVVYPYITACSSDLLQPYSFSQPLIQTFG